MPVYSQMQSLVATLAQLKAENEDLIEAQDALVQQLRTERSTATSKVLSMLPYGPVGRVVYSCNIQYIVQWIMYLLLGSLVAMPSLEWLLITINNCVVACAMVYLRLQLLVARHHHQLQLPIQLVKGTLISRLPHQQKWSSCWQKMQRFDSN